jgi:hypothetical protein
MERLTREWGGCSEFLVLIGAHVPLSVSRDSEQPGNIFFI